MGNQYGVPVAAHAIEELGAVNSIGVLNVASGPVIEWFEVGRFQEALFKRGERNGGQCAAVGIEQHQ